MFTKMTNPAEFMKATTEYFSTFPKNETELKAVLEKVKAVFHEEAKNSQDMWKTYQKAITGDATANELSLANKKAQDLLISTRFAFMLALPGVIFMLPALVEMAKKHNVDLVPQSVKKEFNL